MLTRTKHMLLSLAVALISGRTNAQHTTISRVLSEQLAPEMCSNESCDTSVCECIGKIGEDASCAIEINSICKADGFRHCVPENQLSYVEALFCPYAECIASDDESPESCSCKVLESLCSLFAETTDDCDVFAECCGLQDDASKNQCVQVMMITKTTTTPTAAPSTVSPTASPTKLPTVHPSASPSSKPSRKPSPFPTTKPTKEPSVLPSASPSSANASLWLPSSSAPVSMSSAIKSSKPTAESTSMMSNLQKDAKKYDLSPVGMIMFALCGVGVVILGIVIYKNHKSGRLAQSSFDASEKNCSDVSEVEDGSDIDSPRSNARNSKTFLRDVIAPTGKLGILIENSIDGPIVRSLYDDSPLLGSVFVGDVIVALDDEETSALSAYHLKKLVARKSGSVRKLTLFSTK